MCDESTDPLYMSTIVTLQSIAHDLSQLHVIIVCMYPAGCNTLLHDYCERLKRLLKKQ